MKVGADKEDKMYEDLTNIDKVKQVLGDVCILYYASVLIITLFNWFNVNQV